MCEKNKKVCLDTDLITFTKINPTWITDIHVKGKTIKLLDSNIEKNSDDLGYCNGFLDAIPKALSMKEVTDKLNFTEINFFCKRQIQENEKESNRLGEHMCLSKDTSYKIPLSKIHKEHLKLQ